MSIHARSAVVALDRSLVGLCSHQKTEATRYVPAVIDLQVQKPGGMLVGCELRIEGKDIAVLAERQLDPQVVVVAVHRGPGPRPPTIDGLAALIEGGDGVEVLGGEVPALHRRLGVDVPSVVHLVAQVGHHGVDHEVCAVQGVGHRIQPGIRIRPLLACRPVHQRSEGCTELAGPRAHIGLVPPGLVAAVDGSSWLLSFRGDKQFIVIGH